MLDPGNKRLIEAILPELCLPFYGVELIQVISNKIFETSSTGFNLKIKNMPDQKVFQIFRICTFHKSARGSTEKDDRRQWRRAVAGLQEGRRIAGDRNLFLYQVYSSN